jgi:hypothetical protein
LIPYFLRLDNCCFGNDVEELEIVVNFDQRNGDEKGLDSLSDVVPAKTKFRYVKASKRLFVEYPSQYQPFEDDMRYGRWTLKSGSQAGCKQFKEFLLELRSKIEELAPRMAKRCDFDSKAIMDLIDMKISRVPIDDAMLSDLIQEQEQWDLRNPEPIRELTPPKKSSVPKLIPVVRMREDQMGSYADSKQFWGQVVASSDSQPDVVNSHDWHHDKKWYAVLHKFDNEGRHLGTDYRFIGRESDGESIFEEADKQLEAFVRNLGQVRYGDIKIALFQQEIDGHIFGMIDSSSVEFGPSVTMQPADWVFHPPWDGCYDT